MNRILEQFFCRHDDSEEIGKYFSKYECWGISRTNVPETYLDIYKVYKCNKCGKNYHKRILNKKFLGWNDNRFYQEKLREQGFISEDDFILQ